jgi:hypothetical protein
MASEFRRACVLTREKLTSKGVNKKDMKTSVSIEDRIREVVSSSSNQGQTTLQPILRFSEGNNTLELVLSEPVILGKFGWLYPAVVNGQSGRVGLSKILETQVLTLVKQGFKKIQVTRTGTGLNTRYTVSPIK